MSKEAASSSFTLLSSMVGASLLSCSFIVSTLGIYQAVGLFLLSVTSILCFMHYFTEACNYLQSDTYRNLTSKLISPRTAVLLDICVIVSKFGSLTSYIIIASQAVRNFIIRFIDIPNYAYYLIKIIILYFIMFPLTLLRSLKALSKLAILTGFAIFTTAIAVIVVFFMHLGERRVCEGTYTPVFVPEVSTANQIVNFIKYIPSFMTNFGTHAVIPCLLSELAGSRLQVKRLVKHANAVATMTALFLYSSVGFLGSVMFGKNVSSNLFASFSCDIAMSAMALVYAAVIIIAYPLVLYPVRSSIQKYTKYESNTTTNGYLVQIIINFIFSSLCLVLALFIEEIAIIFAFFSALTGFLFLFYVPIQAGVKYPSLKTEYGYIDSIQVVDQSKDTLSMVLFSFLLGKSVNSVRKIMYKKLVNPLEQGAVREASRYNQKSDNYMEASESGSFNKNINSDTSTSLLHTNIQVQRISFCRKLIGGLLVFIYAVVCLVAVIKNGYDMIISF